LSVYLFHHQMKTKIEMIRTISVWSTDRKSLIYAD